MITSIQFGNIFSSGDKTVVGGTSTGFDTQALIEGLTEAKRLPAVQLEARLEENATKQAAFAEMKDILSRFQTAAKFLRNPPGVQNAGENAFRYRSTTLTSNTTVPAETYVSVTAEPGASISSFELTVDQLATRNIKTTNTFSISGLSGQAVDGGGPFNAGVLTLGSTGVMIVLDSGDTLQQVINKVNAAKDLSGIEMTAIKQAELGANDDYVIVFKAVETGEAQNYGDITTANAGIFNVGFASQIDAVNAEVTIDGTTVERESNAIDDLVSGMTITLRQETPMATTIDLEVNPDLETTRSAIINFIDSYNEFRVFSASQTLIGDDGLPVETAVLSSNATLRNTLNRIMSEMSHIVNGITGGDPSRLADLGITFEDYPGDAETPFTRNILVLDEAILDAALEADFDAVRKVFEFDFASDETDLQVFKRTNSLAVSSFTLDIDITGGIFQATYDIGGGPVTVNLDKTDINGGGILLSGQAGTVLEGLEMIYTDTADSMGISVTVTQGVGDRMFNTLESMLQKDTGLVDVELQSIVDSSDRIEDEIARIDEMVERFRDSLLQRFRALEQVVASVNSLLQSLDAQANARANG